MSKFNLNINAMGSFDTVDAARAAAVAINILLASGGHKYGAVKIYEPSTGLTHAIVRPTFDRSKVVHGSQEAESNATKFSTEIDKLRTLPLAEGSLSTEAFWADFIVTSKGTGKVDIEALEVLVNLRLDGAVDGIDAIATVLAAVAAGDVRRTLNTLKAQKAKAVKRPENK